MGKTLFSVVLGAQGGSTGESAGNWFGRAVAVVACAVLFLGTGIAQAEPVEDFEGFQEAIEAYGEAEEDVVIEVTEDFELEELVAIPANAEGKTLTIKGDGAVLTRGAGGNLFTVPTGARLVLEDIVIDGGGDGDFEDDGEGSLVAVTGSGKLIVKSGAVLRNNNIDDGNGSGVNFNGDSLIIGGNAKITGNTKDGEPNNVFLAAGKYITIGTATNGGGVPAAGMAIGVTKTANDGEFVQAGATAADTARFSADVDDKIIKLDGAKLLIADPPVTFVAVTDITVALDSMVWGSPLKLVGTVVPDSATNKAIVWSIVADSTTAPGAAISADTLRATGAGTAVVRATVTNGATATTNYTKNFTIKVKKQPAPAITPWPTSASQVTLGDKLSESILNVLSNGFGTFAWDDPDIEPELDNEDGYDVKFTPSAATLANYEAIHADSLVRQVVVPVTEFPTFEVRVTTVTTLIPGKFAEGDTVSITAGTVPAGLKFATWRSDSEDVVFLDSTSAATRFIMPAEAVEITAIYDAATPVFTTEPQSRSVKLSIPVTLKAVVAVPDSGTVTYQWYSFSIDNPSAGGTVIAGATDTTLAVKTDELGTYSFYVVVTNTNNRANGKKIVTTESALITVAVMEGDLIDAEFPVVSGPANMLVEVDTDTVLTVTASSPDSGTLSYQWYRNTVENTTGGTKIDGATDSTYAPATDSLGTFYYYVEVTNTNDDAEGVKVRMRTSRVVTVTVVTDVSVASNDRVIPQGSDGTALIVQVKASAGRFTAGPNPVSRQAGVVNFFRQGKRVDNAVLSIFNASGTLVNKIRISDGTADSATRTVGSWNLTDTKGRIVPTGTYLVRGVVTDVDGRKERVSLVVGVR